MGKADSEVRLLLETLAEQLVIEGYKERGEPNDRVFQRVAASLNLNHEDIFDIKSQIKDVLSR